MFFSVLLLSLLPQQSSKAVEYPSLYSRDECQCPGRSIWELVWSCLGTMFICLWTAIHPNIPGPDETGWTALKRRFQMMLYTFLAPELVVMWAMYQAVSARKIASDFNKARGHPEPPKLGLWRTLRTTILDVLEAIKVWFRGPKNPSQPGPQWTTTHGFFVQMGGFMLYKNGRPWYTLSYEELERLIGLGSIDVPTVTEAEIKDKSKGDFLSKSVIVLQTTWFVVQCGFRWKANLPLSKLEVVTLAFAALNWCTYVVWWSKPHNVQTPIPIHLKSWCNGNEVSATQEGVTRGPSKEQLKPIDGSAGQSLKWSASGVDVQEEQEDGMEEQPQSPHKSWFTRHIVRDYNRYRNRGFLPFLWFIVWRVPYRFMSSFARPFDKITRNDTIPLHAQRVPMYYASKPERREDDIITWVVGCTSILFGAFHCIAWDSPFPSGWQRWLWRASSLIMIAMPASVWLYNIALSVTDDYVLEDSENPRTPRFKEYLAGAVQYTSGIIIIVMTPIYVASRFFVLIQAFISLRDSPAATFQAIKWNEVIPHIR